ncbi:MAG TPA: hypothetical protein ENH01_06175 [Nitrospirae bacterium]|nr:hypothetical protein [Nitrospirota bacterium]
MEKGEFSIVEYPVIAQDRYNPFPYYQSFHRKKILNGYFLSHALKKQWKTRDILASDVWLVEIIMSRIENNKLNFSRLVNLSGNFIDLYDINALRSSGAKYIILHKNIGDEIMSVKDDPRVYKDFMKGTNSREILRHIGRFSSHFNEYFRRYFGEPVYENDLLIVFRIDAWNPGDSSAVTPARNALVTFQFDHPFITQYTKAKPLFDSKGIKASLMVNTAEVGKSEYYMSWDQLKEMYNEGWEIGAHTVNHPDLRTLDEATVRYELSGGKAILEAHGFQNIKNFAYPFNWYNMDVLYVISDYYRSARTSVAQTGFFINPENTHPYELSAYEARLNIDNVADAYKYVDKAQKEGRWLIFLMHEFRDNKRSYTLSKEITDIKALEMLINYIRDRNIPIVTTEQALNYYTGFEMPGTSGDSR